MALIASVVLMLAQRDDAPALIQQDVLFEHAPITALEDHAVRDLVPRSAWSIVATFIRSIFDQPDEAGARAQLRRAVDGLEARFPQVAELLIEAEADLLVHFTFPDTHRPRIRSTNPLERLNEEIKRRTQVVGILPTGQILIRLVCMVLGEQDDEWQDGRRYFRPESMALIDAIAGQEEEAPALLMAS